MTVWVIMDWNSDGVQETIKEWLSFLIILQRKGTNCSKLIGVTVRESLNMTIFLLENY